MILAALALAVPTFAAATLAILDYFEGFSFRYSLIEPKIGPDRFIGLEEIIGLTVFRLTTGGATAGAAGRRCGAGGSAALRCRAGAAIARQWRVSLALDTRGGGNYRNAVLVALWETV